ncbi:peptidoglycan/LPS O-acetylase OafA/YrhL [Rhizobium sp. BK049]|uniref:acyltransferase family protein n=1 Tax=Rhizobium sp. BK049 TaxID=2587095 RepID=UPI0016181034|nr:acyltransferase [Rhizobium sp. BK049]MBB3355287.1 peptidoglycan/LPS O-acetylase OafA/YrhL [Rhizobium sp. BK049]
MMESDRLVVLDSWRGIAALAVVCFHFRKTAGLSGIALFNGMYMFVDFFFVLSGFVICAAYSKKLSEGYSVSRFMWLRFGRVYPLHLAVLIAFILLQVTVVYPNTGDWFPAPYQSWDTIGANLLLIHSLNVIDSLTWNLPSWSISVEFYTYLIFALAVVFSGRLFVPLCCVAAIVAPLFLLLLNNGKYLDATSTNGIVRCVYGFAIGCILQALYRRTHRVQEAIASNIWTATTLEIVVVGLSAIFLCAAGSNVLSLAAPLVFAISIFVFAAEGGLISKALRLKPFVFLGSISYSVYMVHMLVLMWWLSFFRGVAHKLGGADFYQTMSQVLRDYIFLREENYTGLALLLLMVVAVSAVTYRLIEEPCRRASRTARLFTPQTTATNAL